MGEREHFYFFFFGLGKESSYFFLFCIFWLLFLVWGKKQEVWLVWLGWVGFFGLLLGA